MTSLIELAAEGIAQVTNGCAGILAAGSRGRPASKASDFFQLKGIQYFGPRIISRWVAELEARSPEDQLNALAELAGLPAEESRTRAAEAIQRLAAGAAVEDKALAIEYLTAIPLAVRRCLMPDPASGRLAGLPTLAAGNEQTLLRFLPADVPPFAIGTVVAGTSYHLEELLGIGGFGAVYKARNRFEQNQPPRAIKFCLDASMTATLHRERAILDRLMAAGGKNWSNRIVRLYGYALDVQPPFLVYEYVPGGDLTSHLMAVRLRTGRGFSPPVVLELVRQVAEALAFAHDQGLVHRDLKPANVLVSGTTIKLTDFGIGGLVASSLVRGGGISAAATPQFSVADQVSLLRGSGTPLYMSAEQRRGDQPDPRHDLYSLGVVWYQLLVGDVTHELHPGWPDELTEEYQTPAEHIELIQRCVGYIKKRAANAGELLSLLPAAAAPRSAMTSAPGTSGLAPGMSAGHIVDFDKLKTLLADQIDHDAFRKARETVLAMLRLRSNDPEALEALAFLDNRLDTRPEGEVLCLSDHQGWIRGVALTADSRRALSGSDDASLRFWDLAGRCELRRLAGHTAPVMSVALTGDSRRALSGSWDGTMRFWDLETGKELRRLSGSWKTIKSVAISSDGRRALAGCDDNLLHLWDLESGTEIRQLSGHTAMIQCVDITSDGRRAVSGGDDNAVRLWDLETGLELRRFDGHTDAVTSVAFAADGRLAISGSSDHTARLWDLTNGRAGRRFEGHVNWVNCVALSADGRRLATGSGGEMAGGRFQDGLDTTVRLWDVASGKELARFEGHSASVTSVALSADGSRALSGSLDKTIRLWQVKSQK